MLAVAAVAAILAGLLHGAFFMPLLSNPQLARAAAVQGFTPRIAVIGVLV